MNRYRGCGSSALCRTHWRLRNIVIDSALDRTSWIWPSTVFYNQWEYTVKNIMFTTRFVGHRERGRTKSRGLRDIDKTRGKFSKFAKLTVAIVVWRRISKNSAWSWRAELKLLRAMKRKKGYDNDDGQSSSFPKIFLFVLHLIILSTSRKEKS